MRTLPKPDTRTLSHFQTQLISNQTQQWLPLDHPVMSGNRLKFQSLVQPMRVRPPASCTTDCRASSRIENEPGLPKHRWFDNCSEPCLPSRQDWDQSCHFVSVCCLHVFAMPGQNPGSKTKEEVAHCVIEKTVRESHDRVGPLIASHSIAQKAMLGLLPRFCLEHCILDPTSRVVKFLNAKFKMEKKLSKLESPRFLSTLGQRLEMRFGERFSKRFCKNLMRKCCRFANSASGDSRWVDATREEGQLLCCVEQESVSILFADCHEEFLDGNLIHCFPVGSKLMTMVEMAKALGPQSNVMPSDRALNACRFPSAVTLPKCGIELEFPFASKASLPLCAGELTRQVLNPWLHNGPIPRKRRRTDP
jgi:hypothetical protein